MNADLYKNQNRYKFEKKNGEEELNTPKCHLCIKFASVLPILFVQPVQILKSQDGEKIDQQRQTY